MRTLINKTESINFKKVFTTFFAALGGFVIIYLTFMVINGDGITLANFWNRITFAGLRGRVFSDILVTFRFFSYLFLAGFHVILALWVYADSKKYNCYKKVFPLLTLITGVIGWLIYMISRVDNVTIQEN